MATITRQELKKQIEAKTLKGVYLMDGTEENLKEEALRQLCAAVLPSGLEELNLSDLENPSADALIAAAETLPFMADQRLVVVRELSGLTSRGEADDRLSDYISSVPPTTLVIFYVSGKADARKKLYKKISAAGSIVTFSQMTEQELNSWIQAAFKARSKLCPAATASLLAFTVGSDTALLKQEIDKLSAYCGDRDGVTDDDVREMATPSMECRIFDLTDAIASGRQSRAFELLRDLEKNGEQRTGILVMILRQYRILQQIKIMEYEKRSQGDMCRLLGIKDFALRRYLQQSRSLSGSEVRDGVNLCLDYEYRIKHGEISENGAPESCMLSLFALKNAAK